MFREHRIALVIPAHNEERLIARTLAHVPDFIDSIIVVDDASTDGTPAIVKNCAASDRRIEIVSHSSNRGPGGAIVTGYKKALEGTADIAVSCDGDCQMPLEQMSNLLEPLVSGKADYVRGNRFLSLLERRSILPRQMPRARLVGNLVLTAATRLATGYTMGDVVNGFSAISRYALERVDWDKAWPGYGYPIDFLIRFSQVGLRVADVPQRTIYLAGERQSQIKVIPYFRGVLPILARGLYARLVRGQRPSLVLISDPRKLPQIPPS
jgi:glycosyltransferase involved in cell wall biosynthesis